jgi:quinol monooxygenase YgiN
VAIRLSELQLTTRMRLRAGRLEQFKRAALECIQQAASKDVGILRYDWLISRDGAACEVREAYSESEALLLHQANLARKQQELLSNFVEEQVITAYAEPSPQLVRLADALGSRVTWFSLFRGLNAIKEV